MANQLTLKVMETIVKCCEGYEPLPKSPTYGSPSYGNDPYGRDASYKSASITQREEALLSSVIHRQTESTAQNRNERTESRQGTSFSKNGVVNLDALLRELKK